MSCVLDKHNMGTIMVRRCVEIPAIAGMFTPCFASVWFIKELDHTAHGGKRHPVVVKQTMMIGIS